MNADQAPAETLKGWVPIIGALSIWFAHFLLAYTAALIWPHQPMAKIVSVIITVVALAMLAVLFVKLRAAAPTSDQTRFARRFGLGSIFIATAGTLFDAAPVLFR